VVGDSVEEAKEKRAKLDQHGALRQRIAIAVGPARTDASGFDPDGQLPPIPETNASKAAGNAWSMSPRATSSPFGSLRQRVRRYGGLAFVGTPAVIADQMEEWLTALAATGSISCFRPARGLDDFVDRVVPELQRRGISGANMRARRCGRNLGLPRPKTGFSRVNRANLSAIWLRKTLTLGCQKLGCPANVAADWPDRFKTSEVLNMAKASPSRSSSFLGGYRLLLQSPRRIRAP